jgi:hypothetical protein
MVMPFHHLDIWYDQLLAHYATTGNRQNRQKDWSDHARRPAGNAQPDA